MTAPATYLYAVLKSAKAPSAEGAPAGPPEVGPLRFLDLGGGLRLAAADAPRPRFEAASIERGLKDLEWVSACALGHERVLEHLASQGATVVPMKLFTLFTTDARAVAHVARSRRALDATVRRLAGRQEWGIRVSVDEQEAAAAARAHGARAAEGLSTGASFLTRKKEEGAEALRIAERGREEAERVFASLTALADETRRRAPAAPQAGLRPLLDAVFLVRRIRSARFEAAARKWAEALRPKGYRVVLTGPWPAYSFVVEEA